MAEVATPPVRPPSRLPISSLSRSRSVLGIAQHTSSTTRSYSQLVPTSLVSHSNSQHLRPPTTVSAKFESARLKPRIHTRSVSSKASSIVTLDGSLPMGSASSGSTSSVIRPENFEFTPNFSNRALKPFAQNRQVSNYLPSDRSASRGTATRTNLKQQNEDPIYKPSSKISQSSGTQSISISRTGRPNLEETPIKKERADSASLRIKRCPTPGSESRPGENPTMRRSTRLSKISTTAELSTARRRPTGPRRPLPASEQDDDVDATPKASILNSSRRQQPSRLATIRRTAPAASQAPPTPSIPTSDRGARKGSQYSALAATPESIAKRRVTPFSSRPSTTQRQTRSTSRNAALDPDATPKAKSNIDDRNGLPDSNITPRAVSRSHVDTDVLKQPARRLASGANKTPMGPRRAVSRSSMIATPLSSSKLTDSIARPQTAAAIETVAMAPMRHASRENNGQTPVRLASRVPSCSTATSARSQSSLSRPNATTNVFLPRVSRDDRDRTPARTFSRAIPRVKESIPDASDTLRRPKSRFRAPEASSIEPPETPVQKGAMSRATSGMSRPRPDLSAELSKTASVHHRRRIPATPALTNFQQSGYEAANNTLTQVIDPFNMGLSTELEILKKIQAARSSGHLNLSSCDLDTFPDEMYDFLNLDTEIKMASRRQSLVALKRIEANDNKLEKLDDRLCSQFTYLEMLNVSHLKIELSRVSPKLTNI